MVTALGACRATESAPVWQVRAEAGAPPATASTASRTAAAPPPMQTVFSIVPHVDLHEVRASLAVSVPALVVRGETDVMLKVAADGAIIDFVRYPYAPLEPPTPGPGGVLLASVRDLGAMKLSTIATRGIRRDFWDAFVIAKNGHSLAQMAADFRTKFGREASDLYHVIRALTYFDDAEADPLFPRGMTPVLWKEVRTYFAREAPRLLQQLTQP